MNLNQVNHIGISVSNLDRSIEFYREITGGELEFVNEMRGEGLARVTGEKNPRLRFCMIRVGNTVLELIEWQQPKGAANGGAGVDVGKIHIAFETDDIQAVYERLQAKALNSSRPRIHLPTQTVRQTSQAQPSYIFPTRTEWDWKSFNPRK
jgi:catechol 2,3-dioxygenase-like lactoylglutathione lyase family enzyme